MHLTAESVVVRATSSSSAPPLVITPYSAPVAQAVRQGPLWGRASVGRGRGGAARPSTEAVVPLRRPGAEGGVME